jgi:oligopeptide/dipeptide ABC transporter ATP-binding protein
MMNPLLSVENLTARFKNGCGYITAVNGMSYHIDDDEIIGIVGESGSGKTASQLSVMRLISDCGDIVSGRVLFENQDLLALDPNGREMCSIRGRKIAMIFQEPASALNPVLTVGRQIAEALEKHLALKHRDAVEKGIELLTLVGIDGARDRLKCYPYQFSGGMLQRVMIAMAISCSPKILIADEPTSALDVTTQVRVLELLKALSSQYGTAMVMVSHNLGIIARYATRIYVMYAGQIVESGACRDVFDNPRHPYTIELLNCMDGLFHGRRIQSSVIPKKPFYLNASPMRCAFLPRCTYRKRNCSEEPQPDMSQIKGQHYVRCYGGV